MLDMETNGASKLDNYQNFAKAFRVQGYAAVMTNIKPNAAHLKSVTDSSRATSPTAPKSARPRLAR